MAILQMSTGNRCIVSVRADAIEAIRYGDNRMEDGDRLLIVTLSSGVELEVNEDYSSVEHRWSHAIGQKVEE